MSEIIVFCAGVACALCAVIVWLTAAIIAQEVKN